MELLHTLSRLVDHEILYDASERPPRWDEEQSYWWDNPRPHVEMLEDEVRTRRFIEAVESTVRRNDVVVEIGTGTGVLAMAAARAGAKRVYTIEAGAIADKAEQVIASNGFSDVVEVVRGWSHRVELPERCDVLVTETIGSDPLDEGLIESVRDARARHLRPNARIIPSQISIFGSGIEVPESDLPSAVFGVDRTRRWEKSYGFDFSPLTGEERRLSNHRVPMATTRRWEPLTPPTRLAQLDLRSVSSSTVCEEVVVETTREGRLDGALLYFSAELAPGVRISTDPHDPNEVPSWWNVLTLRSPEPVRAESRIRLCYRRGAHQGEGEVGLTANCCPSGE
jgi:hypothetical protein